MERLLINILLVAAGGAAGSVTRYLVTLGTQGFSGVLPFGTFIANSAGCFVIGFVSQLALGTELIKPHTRILLTTGFCGGFTTMSSFIYETGYMIDTREYFRAATYFGGTLLASFVAFYAGVFTARITLRTMGGLWS
jgi:fluoride exporter